MASPRQPSGDPGAPRFERVVTILGTVALLAAPCWLLAATRSEGGQPLILASLASALVALVCGLLSRRRWVTMALVVPSLVYLALLTDVFS